MLILTLCACSKPMPQVDVAENFIHKFANEADKEYNLFLFGQGGAFRDGISKFHLCFISQQVLDVDQARRFYLKLMDRILELINDDETLRPYMTNYPFTHHNLDLSILFYENDILGIEVPYPAVAYVSSFDDFICYAAYNPVKDSLEDLNQETIRRARGIVEHQNALMQIPEGCDWVQ